ncbi:inositol monophosphatase family protein [Paracoccus sediminicola]|uniref:inositol monophosphatase family protein n=1 Tax=Paracoccus sediminicola TaxID=3017783 RepID=UPI0022F09752|nr:inositol monophosphatase [Paracoccus sediminicola]WBU56193.1 inositol monophosphatase [Paracoccus sediminicola]
MELRELDLRVRLTAMEHAAREAGDLALRYFRKRDLLDIETKRSLTDMVSLADREVETLIRNRLLSEFRDDAFLGEEHGMTGGLNCLTWVIDPIDGTAPFLNGLPGWCVSIGLRDASGPLLGAIYAPVLDELYLGGRGQGATLNGKPVRVTDRFDLSTGLLGIGANDRIDPARFGRFCQDLSAQGIAHVRYGSGALMLAFVAAGRLVGYCEPRMSIWDCLAGYALIEAAGGRVAPCADAELRGIGFPVLAAIPGDYDRLSALTAFDDPGWNNAAAPAGTRPA